MANLENWEVSFIDVNGAYNGPVIGDITGRTFGSYTLYLADGAIDLADTVAILSSGGASTAMTLANGTIGQRMSLVCTAHSNTADVDANFGGATVTVTFTAAGQGVDLVWSGITGTAGWYIVGNNGATLS